MNRFLDLRFMIGVLFIVYGVVLGLYGAVADPHTASLHANIDLWWGVVCLVFGIVFLIASLAKPSE
ncbi:hypothetical protein [Alicyclobacillus sendaiensis]|uniref:Uncharacterized protein n=1 Tax=Alicyclobacillus sendaiensis PA2 TaxID=3029425 RepID=A0ABT6XYY6_ALISE|nr:hypothetical protein [Alicyclobacillus sendaiensis]MDI9260294.1 hypothetical protein [Alicyclobacillus sendaiensis PA2]